MVSVRFLKKLETLPKKFREVFLEFLEELDNIVTKDELNRLIEVVNNLGQKLTELAELQRESIEAQRETDRRLAELADAQRETDRRLAELAEAQRETDRRLAELAEAQRETQKEIKKLSHGLLRVRQDLGGLSKSLAYGFENEAYRKLPKVLWEKYQIKVKEKFLRIEVDGEEINFFAKAEKNGKECYVVGEAKFRLDESEIKQRVFKQLEKKIKKVKEKVEEEIVPLLVTHFATPSFLKYAERKNVLVVQSFEW